MKRRARGAAIIEVLIVGAFSVGLGLLAMMVLATTEEPTCIATLSCEARSHQTVDPSNLDFGQKVLGHP